VRDYLSALQWDGKKRYEAFLSTYCGAIDGPYARAVARVLFIGLVARAMRPGCKHDCVVVLEGEQSIRKSTMLKTLAGARFFAEATSEIGSKDAQLGMHGKWLLEMPELAGFGKAQVEKIKAHFSSATDWLRPPYAKQFCDLPRSSAPIATTNDSQYLQDRTGNRRYLPILVGLSGPIDVASVERDRDQIWAEATAAFKAGATWWIDRDDPVLEIAKLQVARRETCDPWAQTISAWLAHPTSFEGLEHGREVRISMSISNGISTADVLRHCLMVPAERQHSQSASRVGSVLRQLGMESFRPRDRKAEAEAKERGIPFKRPATMFRWPNPDAEPDSD
jgi:predicted P-loop ATPase